MSQPIVATNGQIGKSICCRINLIFELSILLNENNQSDDINGEDVWKTSEKANLIQKKKTTFLIQYPK